jgi:glycosyltransferase involved in cell wall biosynthesis
MTMYARRLPTRRQTPATEAFEAEVSSVDPEFPTVPKALVVAHYLPPHIGGLECVAQAEADGLSAAGFQVKVVTSSCGADAAAAAALETGPDIVRLRAYNGFEKYGVPFPIFTPKIFTSGWRLVRWADIVHIHDTLYISSWVTAVLCWLLRTPYVVTKHVSFVAHPSRVVGAVQLGVNRLFGRWVLAKAQAILAINPDVERYVVEDEPHFRSKTRVLLNGVDTNRFRPPTGTAEIAEIRTRYGLPGGALVLFAGRFVPKKRLELLLECDSDHYTIVFAGGGPDDPSRSSGNRVFLGSLAQGQLAEVYRAVDIFVCPSISEHIPLTVLEALASRLPVVVEDDSTDDLSSLFGEQLIRVPDLASNLAEVLDNLAMEVTHPRTGGDQGVEAVAESFSLDAHIRNLSAAYVEVLDTRRADRPQLS